MEAKLSKPLLYGMKRLRAIEEEIAARYSQWKMRCPVHLSTGQEAVSVATGLALKKTDTAVSGHRAHGHYIGKGGDLKRMLAEIYGKKTGCSAGKGGSMHLIDESVGFMGSTAIVGGTIPIGVGLAYSFLLKGSDQISCIFLGDAATEEGVFYESANFAALKKLPALFVCENNLYSVYSPLRVRQPAGRKIHELAAAIGIPSAACDGNDVACVYDAIASAASEIRAGSGPRFLEFSNYRWREHCGPNFDNDIGYRTEFEYEEWRAREPIAPFESKLLSDGTLTRGEVAQMDERIQAEITEAFEYAESSPFRKNTSWVRESTGETHERAPPDQFFQSRERSDRGRDAEGLERALLRARRR